MLTLTIPPRRDPIARITLLVAVAVVLYAALASATAPQPATAQADPPVIIVATPTLPMMQPTAAPALTLSAPTPAPALIVQSNPPVSVASGEQPVTDDPPAQLPLPSGDYIANVGAQAEHSPRGDNPPQPPSYQTGPISLPLNNGVVIISDPNPAPPAAPQMAAGVPPISQAQAAVIGARQSNGCAAGEVFYPRTGCHVPGSGGPQPGAVGQP